MMHGPKYTAYNHDFGRSDLREDSEDMMEHRKSILKKHRGRLSYTVLALSLGLILICSRCLAGRVSCAPQALLLVK